MAQTVANLSDILKEVWTSDRLEKQFYDENRWLDKVERTSKYTIGRQAQVPIHKNRSGGFSALLAAGGALNAADEQAVDRADYTLTYNWFQISIETGALNQADGPGARSTVSAVNLEVEGAVADLRKQMNRQFVMNGDGFIAEAAANTAVNVIELRVPASHHGFDAIERGWLYPGLTIDIFDDSAGANVTNGTDRVITAVNEDSAAPDITVSGTANITTAATGDFVTIANVATGTGANNEMNGLRQIAGSKTSAVGGLDPDTAGEEFWKPAEVDTAATVVSLDLLLTLQRRVYQKTGKNPSYVTTSVKQCAKLYELFQNQVRFSSDSPKAGNVEGFTWNGLSVNPDPDILNRDLFMLTLSDFLIVTGGAYSKPTWASDIEGSGGRLRWNQGNTNFVDALVYPAELAIRRRNSHAAATGLTG